MAGERSALKHAATAAAQLAEFCASLRWDALAPEVRQRTPELVLDLLGVAAGGSRQPSTAPVLAAIAETAVSGTGATVLGAGRCAEASWAALVNGTAAHALEMDDVTRISSLHPGAAVIPAALAVAEEQGVSGAAALAAIVAGYEVTMRVGNALGGASAYRRGFHPTGVAGVFGAAIAAGRLLDLDAARLTHALGIAGTMASGSLEYLADGAWTKRLNPGWAAHAGIVAARLARAGFSGPATVFEGRFGFLRGHTGAPRPAALLSGLGERLEIMNVAVKPYGCCRYNHGLIDAMLALRREHGLRPEDVAAIRLGVLSAGAPLVAEPIARKRAPRNVVDAQFSAPFAAALALVRGAAGADQYTDAAVADATIRTLLPRTTCVRDPELDAVYPERWPAWVQVDTRDGRTLSVRVEHAWGEPENPVPRPALVDKFVSLAAETGAPNRSAAGKRQSAAQALADQILHLDRAPDVRTVMAALRG
jgi:2-methylcitrate dehydratase PrpD